MGERLRCPDCDLPTKKSWIFKNKCFECIRAEIPHNSRLQFSYHIYNWFIDYTNNLLIPVPLERRGQTYIHPIYERPKLLPIEQLPPYPEVHSCSTFTHSSTAPGTIIRCPCGEHFIQFV